MDDDNILRRKRILHQTKWRQKQETIYYTTGRPIFENLKVDNYYFYQDDNGKRVGALYK